MMDEPEQGCPRVEGRVARLAISQMQAGVGDATAVRDHSHGNDLHTRQVADKGQEVGAAALQK